jgi:hypothetical protein
VEEECAARVRRNRERSSRGGVAMLGSNSNSNSNSGNTNTVIVYNIL